MNYRSLLLTITALVPGGVNAQAPAFNMPGDEVLEVFTPSQQGAPVLLKLNEWYLLQSYPIAPYRNERGDVMVPLRVVGELLGGQVYLDKAQESGLIVGKRYNDTNHKVEFSAGSSTVQVDENTLEVASMPYWVEASGELIVPLDPLLETFGIEMGEARNDYILPLISYATPGYFALLETYESSGGWIPSGYVDTEQLIPRDVTVRRVREHGAGENTPGSLHIALDLKQTSGLPIPQGQQGFFTLLFKDGSVTLGGRDTAQVLGPGNEDPCRRREGGFRCQQVFTEPSPGYVVALVRVRE